MAHPHHLEMGDGRLAGKVAVVIGGGRGIGRATAHKLAAAGAQVVVVARTASEVEQVVSEIRARGGQATAHMVDVTLADSLRTLAKDLRRTYGRVDLLINSAGVSFIAPLEATAEADWDLVLDTNLKGPYLSVQAMLDLLRASGCAQVVNIASKVGLTGHEQVTAYTAAKAGLIGFGRALAQELSADNIRVTTLCPGPVDTPMRWAATPHMDRSQAISAESVAETILFLATRDCHSAIGNEVVIEAIGYDEGAVSLER
jgi:NAD(P)-dependent dehydrogenase (short-subunit alcohol dehydrogenase family)